jgi:hypothetical protein
MPLVLAPLAAGCPIGCPKGNPQTLFAAPSERLAIRQTGKCTYQVLDPLPGPFPRSEHGFYSVDFNDWPVYVSYVSLDEETRALTVLDEWCNDELKAFGLWFTRYYWTVQQ